MVEFEGTDDVNFPGTPRKDQTMAAIATLLQDGTIQSLSETMTAEQQIRARALEGVVKAGLEPGTSGFYQYRQEFEAYIRGNE